MPSRWGRRETIIRPRNVPIYTITSFTVVVLALVLFMWQRVNYWLSPLERTYITDYFRTAVGSSFNHSGTYQLIYLQGPNARPRLALPVDFQAGSTTLPNGKRVPVELTALPHAQGYRWWSKGRPEPMTDFSLHRWLRFAIFDGESLPRVFRMSFLETGFCLVLFLGYAVPADIKRLRVIKYGRVLRGPVMMTPGEFNAAQIRDGGAPGRLAMLGAKALTALGQSPEPPVSEGIGFKTIELGRMMRIPARKEAQHFQLMGDTGAGKTTLIMQILRQIRDRDDVAVVYDPAGEFIRRFYNKERGDIVLNPLDKRCPFWSPAMELETNEEAITIAESLYQPASGASTGSNREFFHRTPAEIFAELLKEGPTPHTLAAWMADEDVLQQKLRGTVMAHYIDRRAGPQAAGVLSSLGLVARSLQLLPRREDTTAAWNATDWAKERKGWIFLTSSQLAHREILRPLISLWVDILVMRTLVIPRRGQKKVWFVIDELASLQKLPQLHTAITESRKSQNPLVLGLQGKSQVEDIYGKLAEVMLSQPATKIFMKTTEPKAAEWISDTIGKVEIERVRETHFDGTRHGHNFTVDRQIEPLVMASEISGLDDRHAFLKLGNNVTRFDFDYIDLPCETEAFIPRESKDDRLAFERRTLTRFTLSNAGASAPQETTSTPASSTGGVQRAQDLAVVPLKNDEQSLGPVLVRPLIPPHTITKEAAEFLEELERYLDDLRLGGKELGEADKQNIRDEWTRIRADAENQQIDIASDPILRTDLETFLADRHHHHPEQIALALE